MEKIVNKNIVRRIQNEKTRMKTSKTGLLQKKSPDGDLLRKESSKTSCRLDYSTSEAPPRNYYLKHANEVYGAID